MFSRMSQQLRRMQSRSRQVKQAATYRPSLEALENRCLPSGTTIFQQTDLVSDQPGVAQITDPNLVNAWGIGLNPAGGAFWVSDNGTGMSSLYAGDVNGSPLTQVPFSVSIPGGDPTGQVFNPTNGFVVSAGGHSGRALFIFATESGVISGWNPGVPAFFSTQAQAMINLPGAVFKGITLANNGTGNFLYAADFHGGQIDVFNSNWQMVHLAGSFRDPFLPAGFAPFNVANINGRIFVTYAMQNALKHDDVAGPGNGFIDMFDTNGHFLRRIASRGPLNSPWGMAVAPSTFGAFSNDLLVGNFGDGRINAFNLSTGMFVGQLHDVTDRPLTIDGLWGLTFGNGVSAGNKNTLFFSAGPNGEQHGLFGSLSPVPVISRRGPLVPNLAPGPQVTASTIPANGDLNPYGVAFVPNDVSSGGLLQGGDILVSNFNNSSNLQGTGTTIVQFDPQGHSSTFFQGQPGLGLTTALGVLKSGFVIVGSTPTTDGTSNTIQNGSLLILDKNGNVVMNLSDSAFLQGPWDLAINDRGTSAQVFVSNVLSGTITRINLTIPTSGVPAIQSITQIASGYVHHSDPAALEVGPTGLAFDPNRDVLYVASTGDNEVFAVPNAAFAQSDQGKGRLIYQDAAHLHGPLGLVIAPNGDLITANGDAVNADPNQPSEIVEFTPTGQFVAQFRLDPGPDAAFGLALTANSSDVRFAAVNDNTNSLEMWTFGFDGKL